MFTEMAANYALGAAAVAAGEAPPAEDTAGAGASTNTEDSWAAVCSASLRLRVGLCVGLQASVQLVGINAVTFYTGDIFANAGARACSRTHVVALAR